MSGSADDEAWRALEDHRSKVSSELGPGSASPKAGLPAGDAGLGILVVLQPPETPAVLDALGRSLDSVGLPNARVVSANGGLSEEILSGGPAVIVALGSEAADALDGIEYPLAHARFSEEREGEWFAWSKGARGLRLPALAPALEDEEAKRDFWRAFLVLRGLETA